MPDEETLLALLDQWESVHKKGALTFWLMLMLHQKPMYAFEMGPALTRISNGTLTVDRKSLYRALRRFETSGMVESTWQASDRGPKRRYYHLTPLGTELLRRFTQRNILIFQEPTVAFGLARLMQTEK
jgi:PadR family transcriptional regulator PadR